MKNVGIKNRCWMMSASYRRCNHSLHLRRDRVRVWERRKERNGQNKNTILHYLRVKSLQGLAINLCHFCFSNMVIASKLVNLRRSRAKERVHTQFRARHLALFSISFRRILNCVIRVHRKEHRLHILLLWIFWKNHFTALRHTCALRLRFIDKVEKYQRRKWLI